MSSGEMTFAERYEEIFEGYLAETLDRLRDKPSVSGDQVRAVIINMREYFRYHTRVNKENMEKKISNLIAAQENMEKKISDLIAARMSAKINMRTKNNYLCEIEQTQI